MRIHCLPCLLEEVATPGSYPPVIVLAVRRAVRVKDPYARTASAKRWDACNGRMTLGRNSSRARQGTAGGQRSDCHHPKGRRLTDTLIVRDSVDRGAAGQSHGAPVRSVTAWVTESESHEPTSARGRLLEAGHKRSTRGQQEAPRALPPRTGCMSSGPGTSGDPVPPD